MIELIPYENLVYLKKRHFFSYDLIMNYKEEVFERLLNEGRNEVYDDIDFPMAIQLLEAQLKFIHSSFRRFSMEGTIYPWKEQAILSFERSVFSNQPKGLGSAA